MDRRTIEDDKYISVLQYLLPQGFYVVHRAFAILDFKKLAIWSFLMLLA